MTDWIRISLDLFNQSSDRIIWNLFLAFIPLILSYYLFRPLAIRNLVWWIALIVFLAFLPNAPYILTDSIHIIELSQKDYPLWAIAFILIPQYTFFITVGFGTYVVSLIKLDRYLIDFIDRKYITLINGLAHFLCVVGIYLGRFERFNSWDLVTKPGKVILTTVEDLFDIWKIFSIAIAFFLIWLLSELIKLVNNSFAVPNSGND
ncbi:DUF1361 domain-containing protein [Waterburya agarophytonicola K14]|uniref:DUF1361 domain-containing protein n=1 Tax=Waterburya agarophytonicola KI4 TaxID=2874699 RepID=A0A964BQ33_9CYAN|nr:DUF1361 domain-containing protein [Waterburya agarophytonicola]MCC0176408.1 DUF1361 domain-containing protein [Waterburya agarophytonicola KI4]